MHARSFFPANAKNKSLLTMTHDSTMKSPVLTVKLPVIHSGARHQTVVMSPAGRSLILVADVPDKEAFKFPDIHISGAEKTNVPSAFVNGQASSPSLSTSMILNRSFQGSDYLSRLGSEHGNQQKTLSKSLLDIREESMGSDSGMTADLRSSKRQHNNGQSQCASENSSTHSIKPCSEPLSGTEVKSSKKAVERQTKLIFVEALTTPDSQHRQTGASDCQSYDNNVNSSDNIYTTVRTPQLLLPTTDNVSPVGFLTVSSHLMTHGLSENLSACADQPTRRKPPQVGLRKAHSQREFILGDMETCLPRFLCAGSLFQRDSRNALKRGNSGKTSPRSTVAGTVKSGSPLSLSRRQSAGGLRYSRSSSLLHNVSALPPLSSAACKSSSQPNMVHTLSPNPLSSVCGSPPLRRRARVRELWLKVRQRMGLGGGGGESAAEADVPGDEPGKRQQGEVPVWVLGPGDLPLRPAYVRWSKRRDALAEPEKMIMPQELRERIQKEVEIRKASLTRKVSNLLTIKLGLDKEEDLMT